MVSQPAPATNITSHDANWEAYEDLLDPLGEADGPPISDNEVELQVLTQIRRAGFDQSPTDRSLARWKRCVLRDFLRSLHVALRRPERMKSGVLSPAFRPQAFGVSEWVYVRRFRLKAGLRTDFLRRSRRRTCRLSHFNNGIAATTRSPSGLPAPTTRVWIVRRSVQM